MANDLAIIDAEFVPAAPRAFESNAARLWVHQEGHSQARTWAVRILFGFTIVPFLLTLFVDLGRYMLYRAGYLNGKSFSLIDLVSGSPEEESEPLAKTATKVEEAAQAALGEEDEFIVVSLMGLDEPALFAEAKEIKTLIETSLGALKYLKSHQEAVKGHLEKDLDADDREGVQHLYQVLVDFRQLYNEYAKKAEKKIPSAQLKQIHTELLALDVAQRDLDEKYKAVPQPKHFKKGEAAVKHMIHLVQECNSKHYEDHGD